MLLSGLTKGREKDFDPCAPDTPAPTDFLYEDRGQRRYENRHAYTGDT